MRYVKDEINNLIGTEQMYREYLDLPKYLRSYKFGLSHCPAPAPPPAEDRNTVKRVRPHTVASLSSASYILHRQYSTQDHLKLGTW